MRNLNVMIKFADVFLRSADLRSLAIRVQGSR